MSKKIIVVGSGNAAMCAGIAALEAGAEVLMLEKADEALAGGNTKYTAGAMRFAYDSVDDLMPLLKNKDDPRLAVTDFDGYTTAKFADDLSTMVGTSPAGLFDGSRSCVITPPLSFDVWIACHTQTPVPR